MEYYVLFVLFAFGLLIGSFLNVVILRHGTGTSVAKGRSKCFSCDKELSWRELVPLLSFMLQKGKCRGCHSKISWQYPIVELAAGLALVGTYKLLPGLSQSFSYLLFFLLTYILLCLYIVICAYDARHKIIPDLFSYSAAAVALALAFIDFSAFGFDLSRLLAGPILFAFFYFFWLVSKGRWMGLGDAKLALSVGWTLGLWQGIAAILLAFWIGAIASIAAIAAQKLGVRRGKLGLRSEIPFGPFILLGFVLSLFFHIDMHAIFSVLAV